MEPLDPGTSKAASIATAAATVKVAGAPPLSTSKAASCLSPPPRIVPVPRAPLGPPIGGPVGPFISGPGPELPVKAPPSHGISAKMPPPQFEVVSGGVIGVKMPPVGPPPLAPPEMLSTSLPILPPGLGLAPPVGPLPAVLMQPPLEPPAGLLAAVDAAVVRAGAPARPVEKLEWQAHTSPEGIPFFFCKKTGESRWVRPCGPGDTIVEAKAEAEVRKEPQAGSLKEKLGEPETWESIGKTGWTRVETDKGYTYFYHKKQKKTSWTCPPEIAKEVAALDGSLGAADEGGKDEEDGKAAAEETPDAPETEPADGDEDGPKKQTRAERAEKRAHQVEEEQKAAKEKDKLRNFKQLLVEKGVRAFDKYDKWVPKLMHDPRFTAVTSLKERRLLFEMLAKKIETEKRKTQAVCKNRGREAFKELVDKADQLDLLAGRTVEKALASMERRFGDEAQWDAVPERDRERMVAEAVAEATKRVEKQKEEARAKFRAAVTEGLRGKEEDPPAFSKARRWLEHDPSWEQLGSTERENLYGRLARELKDAKRKQDAKKREVQQELEEARKKRKLSEAEEKIFSVLSERMKNPFSMTWEEAKPEVQELQLQKTFGLRDNELEQLWLDYQRRAIDARREAWLCILDAAGFEVIGPELEFEEVVQRSFDANTDVATQKAFEGMPEDVLKESWKQWRERAYELAVEDCQQWLRTCQHLRGCEDVEPTGGDDFDRLMRRLAAKDIRFRRLNGRPEQQTRLLAGRLRELRSLRGQKKDEGEEEEYM